MPAVDTDDTHTPSLAHGRLVDAHTGEYLRPATMYEQQTFALACAVRDPSTFIAGQPSIATTVLWDLAMLQVRARVVPTESKLKPPVRAAYFMSREEGNSWNRCLGVTPRKPTQADRDRVAAILQKSQGLNVCYHNGCRAGVMHGQYAGLPETPRGGRDR